jgi:hypothetical protein
MNMEAVNSAMGLQPQNAAPPPQLGATPIGQITAPSPKWQEVMFRTIGSAMPAPGSMRYNNGGQLAGLAAMRLLGGFSNTMANELYKQRNDPQQEQFAIANQLEQMGTQPAQLPPSLPLPSSQRGPVAGPALEAQQGAPAFAAENIPATTRMALANRFPMLTDAAIAANKNEQLRNQILTNQLPWAGARQVGNALVRPNATGGVETLYEAPPDPLEKMKVENAFIAQQRSADFANRAAKLDPTSPTYGEDLLKLQVLTGVSPADKVVDNALALANKQQQQRFERERLDLYGANIRSEISNRNANQERLRKIANQDPSKMTPGQIASQQNALIRMREAESTRGEGEPDPAFIANIDEQLRHWVAIGAERAKATGVAAPALPTKSMADMPPAAQNSGKILRDTVTGQRYKSDGKSWQPIK